MRLLPLFSAAVHIARRRSFHAAVLAACVLATCVFSVTATAQLHSQKQFVPREAQSLKIEVLKDNTELMSVALDDMRKTREEERRRLNER